MDSVFTPPASDTAQRLAEVTAPLPGSVPYDNLRPITVPAPAGRLPLVEMLCFRFPQIPRSEWETRCDAGNFIHRTGRILTKDDRLPAGERLMQRFPGCVEPPVATDIRVVHEDDALLVLDKPAPLPMHPGGRFNRNTLHHFLRLAFGDAAPLPVHRLDANTTGLVAFAKSRAACHALQRQFIEGGVTKDYLVRAQGHPAADEFAISAPISTKPGATGTHAVDEVNGRPARTRARPTQAP